MAAIQGLLNSGMAGQLARLLQNTLLSGAMQGLSGQQIGQSGVDSNGGADALQGLNGQDQNDVAAKRDQIQAELYKSLQNIKTARSQGDEPGAAVSQLKSQFQEAQSDGIALDPDLEKAIRAELGDDASQNQAGGGNSNGSNSDGVNNLLGGLGNNFGSGGGGGGGCNGGGCNGGGGLNGGGGGGFGPSPVNFGPTPQPWGADDRGELEDFMGEDNQEVKDSTHTWRQGQQGNCAMVGDIKAATTEYGKNVFDEVNPTEDGYDVKKQDGTSVHLSNQELAMASQASNFQGSDRGALDYANLQYGVAAKTLAGGGDIRSGFAGLNNGFDPQRGAGLLGLQNNIVATGSNGSHSSVNWSSLHCVSGDKTGRDIYGNYMANNVGDGHGNSTPYSFSFKPQWDKANRASFTTSQGKNLASGGNQKQSPLPVQPVKTDPKSVPQLIGNASPSSGSSSSSPPAGTGSSSSSPSSGVSSPPATVSTPSSAPPAAATPAPAAAPAPAVASS